MRRFSSPLRASAFVAAAASGLASIAVAYDIARASTPPDPPPPTVTVAYADGRATAPDGSFTAAFATAPTYTPSADGLPERLYANADEDAQEVARFGIDAFGASAETSPTERAELFVVASGTGVEWLANTPTHLGPDAAAYFIARLVLGDGRPAVVYGMVVVGAEAGSVTYAFATDVGADDTDRSRDFVASYTSLLAAPIPVPPSTTTLPSTPPPTITSTAIASTSLPTAATARPTSTSPTSAPDATPSSAASSASAPSDPSAPSAPVTTGPVVTSIPGPPVPVSAVAGPDRTWWATFPDGAAIAATASTDDGFAYTEYRSVVAGDRLSVRAVETPDGYDWDQRAVPGFPEATVDGEPTTVDASPGVRSTFDDDGSAVIALVVHTGPQVLAVTYVDDGGDDADAADEFVRSLGLAS